MCKCVVWYYVWNMLPHVCFLCQATPSCSGALVLRRRESFQATLVVHAHWNCAAWGNNSWIPTSGRRLAITGGRCPALSFTRSETLFDPVMVPRQWMAWYALVWFFLSWICVHTFDNWLHYVFARTRWRRSWWLSLCTLFELLSLCTLFELILCLFYLTS